MFALDSAFVGLGLSWLDSASVGWTRLVGSREEKEPSHDFSGGGEGLDSQARMALDEAYFAILVAPPPFHALPCFGPSKLSS